MSKSLDKQPRKQGRRGPDQPRKNPPKPTKPKATQRKPNNNKAPPKVHHNPLSNVFTREGVKYRVGLEDNSNVAFRSWARITKFANPKGNAKGFTRLRSNILIPAASKQLELLEGIRMFNGQEYDLTSAFLIIQSSQLKRNTLYKNLLHGNEETERLREVHEIVKIIMKRIQVKLLRAFGIPDNRIPNINSIKEWADEDGKAHSEINQTAFIEIIN